MTKFQKQTNKQTIKFQLVDWNWATGVTEDVISITLKVLTLFKVDVVNTPKTRYAY